MNNPLFLSLGWVWLDLKHNEDPTKLTFPWHSFGLKLALAQVEIVMET